MEEKNVNRQFSRNRLEKTNKQIPYLFQERLKGQEPKNKELKQYFRMLRRDKRVGGTVQVHFDRISQGHIEKIVSKYPKTTKVLCRLAQRLVEGEYGEELQLAATGLSEKLFSHRAVMFLSVIDLSPSEFKSSDLFPTDQKEPLSKLLEDCSHEDSRMVALGEKNELSDKQRKIWNQLNSITASINIPIDDMDVLVKIFKGYVTNFATPSHITVEMMIDAKQDIDQTIKATLSIKNKEERARSLVHIVDRLLNSGDEGDLNKAIEVIQNIENEANRAKPLMKLIDRLSSSHLKDLPSIEEHVPFEKIEEIIYLAKQIGCSGKKHKILQRIAIGLARHNDAKQALEVCKMIPDQDLRAYAKSSSVNMLVNHKNFDKANWLLNHIHEPGYREDAISYIVKGYLDEGLYSDVIAFVDELESSYEKSRAARIILNTAIATHDVEKEKLVKEHFSIV